MDYDAGRGGYGKVISKEIVAQVSANSAGLGGLGSLGGGGVVDLSSAGYVREDKRRNRDMRDIGNKGEEVKDVVKHPRIREKERGRDSDGSDDDGSNDEAEAEAGAGAATRGQEGCEEGVDGGVDVEEGREGQGEEGVGGEGMEEDGGGGEEGHDGDVREGGNGELEGGNEELLNMIQEGAKMDGESWSVFLVTALMKQ
jgi:hypothetical protein